MAGKIVNWNIERNGPATWQAKSLLAEIAELGPDVVCLTEAWETSAEALGGHAISAPGAAWSTKHDSERKVLLWSKHPWRSVETIDQLEATGSAITGLTLLADMHVRVTGLCVPYHFASPFGQEPKAKPWSQHERFLEDLSPLLRQWRDEGPVIILGDFNQFMPRVWGPKRSHQLMEEAFAGYSIVTSGEVEGVGARAIDHVAFSGNLHPTRVFGLPAARDGGRRRSDHFGVVVECRTNSAEVRP